MDELLKQIDELIVAGRLSEARRAFADAGRSGQYRKERLGYARLARRLDQPLLGLRILHPVVNAPVGPRPSAEVQCEYAACLSLVGATTESGAMLRSLEGSGLGECLLFQGFNSIAQWNYQAAAEYLTRYLARSDLTPYQRTTGQANLVAALNFTRSPQARPLLDELLAKARETGYRRLLSYLLIRKGELEVGAREWGLAFAALGEALSVADEGSMDHFLVQKWSAIASLYAHEERRALTLHELASLRKKAEQLREWETTRSLDYHQAVAMGDEDLARRVYFGTPHASFLERLRSKIPSMDLDGGYLWREGSEHNIEISLEEGFAVPLLRRGQLGHRLLLALSRDFYRPLKPAALFALLYPEERFNVLSSPVRLRKNVERVRAALSTVGAGIQLDTRAGMYSLRPLPGVALRVSAARVSTEPLTLLASTFPPGTTFTTSVATKPLQLSRPQTTRLLRRLVGSGRVERIGAGRGARYRLRSAA